MINDFRYALLMLLKSPGFTTAVVLTLALGIGANTAVFSVVNGVLLRSLPYANPDRLYMISLDVGKHGYRFVLPMADFLIFKEQTRTFEQVAAVNTTRINMTVGREPERILGTWVSAGFFSTLGAQPMLGRSFLPDEDRPGSQPVAVVSHSLWRRSLNSDPNAIGRTITLDSKSYTIIGVMPPDFKFPRPVDVWPIMQLNPPQYRGPYNLGLLGRLKPGISEPQVRADFTAIRSQILREYPKSPSDWTYTATPLKEYIVGKIRRVLLVLLAAVVFVLLIACANVANLQLSRAAAREREIAVRTAMGASRFRLIRQLFTEGVLLALAGGAVGLLLAAWGVDGLLALEPGKLPRLDEAKVDGAVLGFTLLASLLSSILFGLVPALQVSLPNLNETLKESDRSGTEGRSWRQLHGLLAILQISLALMLLIGAGLMIRSFMRLQQVTPGFNPEGLLTMQISLPQPKYPLGQPLASFYQQLLQRVQMLPGVQSATISMSIPPDQLTNTNGFTVEGEPVLPGEYAPQAEEILISPDYFRALGIPLLRGRYFSEADTPDKPAVVIINATAARRYFPNEDPIGKRVQRGDPNPSGPWDTIVGVVGDVHYGGLAVEKSLTVYAPYVQDPWQRTMYMAMRTSADPNSLVSAVRHEVETLDNELPISNIKTGQQLLYESVAQPWFRTLLLGIFAGLALVLASVGIYGVIAYSVTQRTHEIGIRMALGAKGRDILRLVVGQGMALAMAGVGIGWIGAVASTRIMSNLLFSVSATDTVTYISVSAILLAVTLLASYIPARRATKVDPTVALRYE